MLVFALSLMTVVIKWRIQESPTCKYSRAPYSRVLTRYTRDKTFALVALWLWLRSNNQLRVLM